MRSAYERAVTPHALQRHKAFDLDDEPKAAARSLRRTCSSGVSARPAADREGRPFVEVSLATTGNLTLGLGHAPR